MEAFSPQLTVGRFIPRWGGVLSSTFAAGGRAYASDDEAGNGRARSRDVEEAQEPRSRWKLTGAGSRKGGAATGASRSTAKGVRSGGRACGAGCLVMGALGTRRSRPGNGFLYSSRPEDLDGDGMGVTAGGSGGRGGGGRGGRGCLRAGDGALA